MSLRGGYLFGIAVLLGIQMALAFGSIGLLSRMSPAVQEILAENVYSNEAAEDMLSAMALSAAGVEGDHGRTFESALDRARKNITVDAEVVPLEALGRLQQGALAGDREALANAVSQANQLIRVNRDAMQVANERARRLGTTGAWAAVALALAGWLASVVVVGRAVVGLVEPVEELHATLKAHREGDPYRRCQSRRASMEMRQILSAVNVLLDRSNRVTREKLDASDD